MKVAFGGVDSVGQPPRQPDRSNKQTGTSNALAFPGIVFISPLCAKRQKMLEDMEKDFEGIFSLRPVDKRQISLMEEEVAKAVDP
ncbi:hypothetical protein YC2023_116002 [Brassica napus]